MRYGFNYREVSHDLIACSYFGSSLGLSIEASFDLLFMSLCSLCLEFGSISQTTSDIILKHCIRGTSSKG